MAEFDTGDLQLPKHWQENTKPPKFDQGTPLTPVVRFADRHKKLPIIELRQAA